MVRWISRVFLVLSIGGCAGGEPAACPEASSGGESTATNTTVEQDIREVLLLTNAIGNAQQMMSPMLLALAQAYPSVPQNLWAEMMSSMGDDEFAQLLIDVYKRNYTREEIAEMLRFYRSEIGRSIMGKMPKVIAESQQAGGLWGQRLAERLLEGARQRGYEL